MKPVLHFDPLLLAVLEEQALARSLDPVVAHFVAEVVVVEVQRVVAHFVVVEVQRVAEPVVLDLERVA